MNYEAIISLVYGAKKFALDKRLKSNYKMKGKADFVTETDTTVSDYIKRGLKEIAPEAAFVTEEEPTHINCGKRFILDPIDGTTNLVRGYNMSSISLGYYENGEITFGVVFDPFNSEMFFAVKGRGAHLYEAKRGIKPLLCTGVENYSRNLLHVSAEKHGDAIVEFGAGSTNKEYSDEIFKIGKKVFDECLDLRRISSTALSLCFIAAGRIDGYFERRIKPWDYAAAHLILEEAGGKLSQWSGEKLPFDRPSTIVAGNAEVYGYLLGVLRGARGEKNE